MADPLLALLPPFKAAIARAFGPEHADTDPALRRSDRADYQANVAMSLRKAVGGSPRDVALAIVKHLELGDIAEKVEVAGAGFINVTLKAEFLARQLTEVAADAALGIAPAVKPETVVVDYSAPNVAKEMHVGHLRSSIIGDAICRVLEATGHKVIRQNHVGDWGTPFGMLIEHLLDSKGSDGDHSVSDLGAFYQAARAKFDSDEAFAERARQRVVLLQGGDEATLALWRKLVEISKQYFSTVYEALSVKLTNADIAGESSYNAMLPDVVLDLEKMGLAKESQGAVCVFPPGFVGREDEPVPLIVRKGDGGYGYATTDLAALRYRTSTLGATRVIYVVGAPQAQHLAMVFKTAELAGWISPPVRTEHVAFGSVLGADKKMFKTRVGETVKLIELLTEAVDRALKVVEEKNPELESETKALIAKAVGVGAVKYADLSSDRVKDYVFEWSRMLALTGNTAPYLQYAHARTCSILRKAGTATFGTIVLAEPAERALALELLGFGAVVHEVVNTLQPHLLCTYLYNLATALTTFYEKCPVLKGNTDAERASRLALCDVTAKVLARGLDLLGIDAPQRM